MDNADRTIGGIKCSHILIDVLLEANAIYPPRPAKEFESRKSKSTKIFITKSPALNILILHRLRKAGAEEISVPWSNRTQQK